MIDKIFKDRVPKIIGYENKRYASVLIPLIPRADGSIDVLFQVRSSKLPEQPGDICFPGGMAEAGETPAETAVRETSEELLINPEQAKIIGPADLLSGGTLDVYPFVGWLNDYQGTFSCSEVAEVFTVPLSWFMENEPEIHEVEWKPVMPENFPFDKIYGGRNYAWRERKESVYFYEYGNKVIWGMTAKMMAAFVKIVKNGMNGD